MKTNSITALDIGNKGEETKTKNRLSKRWRVFAVETVLLAALLYGADLTKDAVTSMLQVMVIASAIVGIVFCMTSTLLKIHLNSENLRRVKSAGKTTISIVLCTLLASHVPSFGQEKSDIEWGTKIIEIPEWDANSTFLPAEWYTNPVPRSLPILAGFIAVAAGLGGTIYYIHHEYDRFTIPPGFLTWPTELEATGGPDAKIRGRYRKVKVIPRTKEVWAGGYYKNISPNCYGGLWVSQTQSNANQYCWVVTDVPLGGTKLFGNAEGIGPKSPAWGGPPARTAGHIYFGQLPCGATNIGATGTIYFTPVEPADDGLDGLSMDVVEDPFFITDTWSGTLDSFDAQMQIGYAITPNSYQPKMYPAGQQIITFDGSMVRIAPIPRNDYKVYAAWFPAPPPGSALVVEGGLQSSLTTTDNCIRNAQPTKGEIGTNGMRRVVFQRAIDLNGPWTTLLSVETPTNVHPRVIDLKAPVSDSLFYRSK